MTDDGELSFFAAWDGRESPRPKRTWRRLVQYGPVVTHEAPVFLAPPMTEEEREREMAKVAEIFARRPQDDQPKPAYKSPVGQVVWYRDTTPMLWINKELGRYEFDRVVNYLRTDLYDVVEPYQMHDDPGAQAGDYLVIRVDRDVDEMNLTTFLRNAEKVLDAGLTVTVVPPEFLPFEEDL